MEAEKDKERYMKELEQYQQTEAYKIFTMKQMEKKRKGNILCLFLLFSMKNLFGVGNESLIQLGSYIANRLSVYGFMTISRFGIQYY